MSGLFQLNENEILSFFAVLVRVSVLFVVFPVLGDMRVPGLVKILLSLVVSMVLFPALVAGKIIDPRQAMFWGNSLSALVGTIAIETLFGLILGFTAKLAFDGIQFAGNLIGSLMGLSMANVYDHEQQNQSQVVAEFQVAFAMMIFLALDAHHLMLRAGLVSFKVLGLGGTKMVAGSSSFQAASWELIQITGSVIRFAVEMSAPIAICLFGVNVAFGVMAKALPQLNVLVLSASIGSLLGMLVLFFTFQQFSDDVGKWFEESSHWMLNMERALATGK